MKKLTIKALKEMLEKTLFIKRFLNVAKVNDTADEQIVFMVSYRRYQVEIDIRLDSHYIYLQFCGSVDGFDANEYLTLRNYLVNYLFEGRDDNDKK